MLASGGVAGASHETKAVTVRVQASHLMGRIRNSEERRLGSAKGSPRRAHSNGQDFCCASQYLPERRRREAYPLIALQQIQVGMCSILPREGEEPESDA